MLDVAILERPVIDAFGGAGGWEVNAGDLGFRALGIEWDDDACATRAAAGLPTVQADVAALDPVQFMADHFCGRALWGLIASPPCQAFSMAGSGDARRAIDAYVRAIDAMSAGVPLTDLRGELDEACGDPRGHLVLEPLRWALALQPRWVALEQVETVLPLWEAMATALRQVGYSVWVGVLSAECYGVPQTRRRAILVASLDRRVGCPAQTHQRYVAPRERARDRQDESLFDAPEPTRIVLPAEEHLEPWVSMAQALGWDLDDRVGFARRADTDAVIEVDGVEYRERDFRDASEPAFALTEKARSMMRLRVTNDRTKATERTIEEPAFGHNRPSWVVRTGANSMRDNRDVDDIVPYERDIEAPAPTVDSKVDRWRVLPTGLRAGTNENDVERSIDEPAATIRFGDRMNTVQWTFERPATTIAGDPRVHPPGHKENSNDEPGRFPQRRGEQAIRVSIDEAAVLQSFPADYPWQGSNTSQFRQVGNAIPPSLALPVLKEATGL